MTLQEIRFAPKINVYTDEMPPGAMRLRVPKLILQPLVENAFEHGIRDHSGKGIISLTHRLEGESLIIRVEDNGSQAYGFQAGGTSGAACPLLGQQAGDDWTIECPSPSAIHYGKGYGVKVSRSGIGGLRIELAIPYEGGSHNDETSDR